MAVRPQLAKIADDLAAGRVVPPVTTREFLSWFNAQRRGYWVVRSIRRELEQANLQTVPDFESNYIDATMELRRVVVPKRTKASRVNSEHTVETESADEVVDTSSAIATLVSRDPTYRISKLAAANQDVVSVKPVQAWQSA
jgi:hypothetical protein